MKYQKNISNLKTNYKEEPKNTFIKSINSNIKPFKNKLEDIYLKNSSDRNSTSKNIKEENIISKNDFESQKESYVCIKKLIFNLLNKNEIYNIEQISHFIIKEQKKVNYEYFLIKKKANLSKSNKFEVLVSLIAKYGIIIYYLIQNNKLEEAKNLLLLMIKENINHINSQTFRLFKIYNKLQQKYEIINIYPKTIKDLFKIYSLLIKYCSLFNLSNYKNMFLVRYLSLHSLNFKIFKRKFEIHGFSAETKNELKYLFSICLHYASFFVVKYYCPLKIPISLSSLILKVYRNLNDNISTKKEKTLIINTLFNQSLFYFLNNQSDMALRNLRIAKQKIFLFYNKDNLTSNNYNIITKGLDCVRVNNENNSKNKNEKKKAIQRSLFLGNNSREIGFNSKQKNFSFNSSLDLDQIFLNESNKKKFLKLEDIIYKFDLKYNKQSLRKSNSLINGKLRIESVEENKEELLDIPIYLKKPLFFNIELFMTEVEIDRKNYYMSYEHVKNCLLLILINKKLGVSNNKNENQKRLNIISNYLEELSKKCKNKILSSQIKSLQNFNLSFNKEELGKVNAINDKENDYIKNPERMNVNSEVEKLFLFLSSLSIYQIKLFNDTQPILDSRNDMPIFFSNQFKDTLSKKQRNDLDKLNIMSVNRSSLLLYPNQSILPSNLKFKFPNEVLDNSIKNKKQYIKINFDGSLMNNDYPHITEEKKESEKEIFEFIDDKELDGLKKILLSIRKINKNQLKSYLINNIYFISKILSKSNSKQIEEMINFPEVLIEPIKLYKKKYKYKDKYKIIQEEIIKKLEEKPKFKFLLKYRNLSNNKKKENISDAQIKRRNSSVDYSYSINDSISKELISSDV